MRVVPGGGCAVPVAGDSGVCCGRDRNQVRATPWCSPACPTVDRIGAPERRSGVPPSAGDQGFCALGNRSKHDYTLPMVDEHLEVAWRRALQVKGKDWVAAELQRRPGQPGDPVYDLVFEEPYPTREFCQRWFIEEDNKIFRIAGSTKAFLIGFVVFAGLCFMAVNSWNDKGRPQTPQFITARGSSGGPSVVGNGAQGDIDPMATSAPGSSSSTAANSTSTNSAASMNSTASNSSVCGYATYASAACKINASSPTKKR